MSSARRIAEIDPASITVNESKSREFRCSECRARCTRSTDGTTEYGHRYGCPLRPPELPGGGGVSRDSYHCEEGDDV